MKEPTENEQERALELFEGFTGKLEELNEQLEVLTDWYGTGRNLGDENAQRYVNKAQGLYTMANNVLENTDYTPEASEREVLEETEKRIEDLSDYLTESTDFDHDF